jgi:hypothetical protein
MYRNLVAEMTRQGLRKIDIAQLLNLRYATVLDKINGKSRFFYDEAKAIKDAYFIGLNLEYLFESDQNENKSTA